MSLNLSLFQDAITEKLNLFIKCSKHIDNTSYTHICGQILMLKLTNNAKQWYHEPVIERKLSKV